MEGRAPKYRSLVAVIHRLHSAAENHFSAQPARRRGEERLCTQMGEDLELIPSSRSFSPSLPPSLAARFALPGATQRKKRGIRKGNWRNFSVLPHGGTPPRPAAPTGSYGWLSFQAKGIFRVSAKAQQEGAGEEQRCYVRGMIV